MNKQSFPTFQEASSYARRKAQELGRTVRMKRDGNSFIVITDQSPSHEAIKSPTRIYSSPNSHDPNSWREKHLEEEREREEREQKRRELEQKLIMAEAEEIAAKYLEERKYFESLSDKELDELWSKREESDMDEDETLRLRSVVRERKGITPIADVRANITFCPRCSLPVDNCTCDRGWW